MSKAIHHASLLSSSIGLFAWQHATVFSHQHHKLNVVASNGKVSPDMLVFNCAVFFHCKGAFHLAGHKASAQCVAQLRATRNPWLPKLSHLIMPVGIYNLC